MNIGGGLLGGRRLSRSEGSRGGGFSHSHKISPRTGATSRDNTAQQAHPNSPRLSIRSLRSISPFHAIGLAWAFATTSGASAMSKPSDKPKPTHLTTQFGARSEEHTSELQSLMRISYAVFCLKKKNK